MAVIDSRVNPAHDHILSIAGGAVFVPQADSWVDVLGHGTAVTAAIQEKAPAAEYYAAKVFHHALRTSIAHLVEAIAWALEERMDVINLSLGTRNAQHAARFAPLIAQAERQGCLVISALEAEGEPCYPGVMPGVLGVGLDAACPRHQFGRTAHGFLASPYPRSLPGVPVERNLSGSSFAVANFSGIVAALRQDYSVALIHEALNEPTYTPAP